ncbi:MAG: hypothetical protein IJT34_03170 [Butyrivibrio sp.]|nr:hypothetical protein [Butyrivibrio sp.]
MSDLKYIPFEEEQDNIKTAVTGYWTKRAESFLTQRQHELASPKAARWLGEITAQLNSVAASRDDRLTISALDRPAWDVEILRTIGFSTISTDTTFGDRIFAEKDEFYIPEKMFMIRALK